jgi:hypothetical protein
MAEVGPIRGFICGRNNGPGFAGEKWLKESGAPVEWVDACAEKHGKRFYFARAEDLAERADGLVVIWDGWTKLTEHLIHEFSRREKPVVIERIGTYENTN